LQLLEIIFILLTMVLGWTLFGYFIFLGATAQRNERKTPAFPSAWPFISVVIPCLDEDNRIVQKLENLLCLDYPADRLEFVFADGGSTDQTVRLLNDTIRPGGPIRVIECPDRGKVLQINHVLPYLKGEIIVNTDADSCLAPDTLRWLAAEFNASPDVMVVGACSRPDQTLNEDDHFWDSQNQGRFLESDALSAFSVIAACYAFRKSLLPYFPADVTADDVYVPLAAAGAGGRAVYSFFARAVETRSPLSYSVFLKHKFRKASAVLHEHLRFFRRLPDMHAKTAAMFLSRLAQLTLMPLCLPAWVAVSVSLLASSRYYTMLLCTMLLVLLGIRTRYTFDMVGLPEGQRRHSLKTLSTAYALTALAMLAAVLSYPFSAQGSAYQRIKEGPDNKQC